VAARKNREGLYSAASLRWVTYFGHVHGRIYLDCPDADRIALRAICDQQALGDENRALRTIEAIIDAPVPGDSLAIRFAHFLAWLDARCPKKYRAPSAYTLRQYREIVRGAA